MNKRYLFNDCDLRDYTKQMNPPPERLMLLSLYFITLEYNGEYYALLDYTSYVPGESSDGYSVNKGMWSVPHTAIFVDVGRIKPTIIAEIKNEYKNCHAPAILRFIVFYTRRHLAIYGKLT